MILVPRISEKAYRESQSGTYVFNVPMTANKSTVIAAMKDQYDVVPSDVRFLISKGKPVRVNRGKRAYPGTTTRTDRKKAYVTLPEGSTLDIFAEAEAAAADDSEDKK